MKIAVLFGGTSAERDVSVASGAQVVKALLEAGHDVLAVDTAMGVLGDAEQRKLLDTGVAPTPPKREELALLCSDARSLTQAAGIRDADVIFLALHGGTGEDGTIQAFLDLAGIAYTGSGHSGSANAMDKDVSKHLFRSAGVLTPDWIMAPISSVEVIRHLGMPLAVKPSKQGSSIGLTIVKQIEQLDAAVQFAYQYDDEVMIEQFIAGRELTIGVLNGQALAVGEIITKSSDVFDYESKYQVGGAEEIFPADLTSEQTKTVQELALKAHRALKLRDYSRVDFRMDACGVFYCLEVNTLPGMTSASLLPQSAQALGISFPQLCDHICRLAMERHQKRRSN
jgi:D-alanine-D-alanine ligase